MQTTPWKLAASALALATFASTARAQSQPPIAEDDVIVPPYSSRGGVPVIGRDDVTTPVGGPIIEPDVVTPPGPGIVEDRPGGSRPAGSIAARSARPPATPDATAPPP